VVALLRDVVSHDTLRTTVTSRTLSEHGGAMRLAFYILCAAVVMLRNFGNRGTRVKDSSTSSGESGVKLGRQPGSLLPRAGPQAESDIDAALVILIMRYPDSALASAFGTVSTGLRRDASADLNVSHGGEGATGTAATRSDSQVPEGVLAEHNSDSDGHGGHSDANPAVTTTRHTQHTFMCGLAQVSAVALT